MCVCVYCDIRVNSCTTFRQISLCTPSRYFHEETLGQQIEISDKYFQPSREQYTHPEWEIHDNMG